MDFLENLIQQAEAANPAHPGDYQQDGLLYCGACHTPKQCRPLGLKRVVPCQCACRERRYQAERAAQKKEEERLKIESLRLSGISDKSLRNCRFENAMETETLRKCRSYAKNWDRAMRENNGLLLWGDTGGGKTFSAACIANAVIDRGVPVLITSFPRLLAADWDERTGFLRNVGRFPLLILDDLGAEENKDYALRMVYSVIDERYKSGKPLIVTTNLHIKDLQNPENIAYKRIYQRVLEMCTALYVEPQAFRSESASQKKRSAAEILGG